MVYLWLGKPMVEAPSSPMKSQVLAIAMVHLKNSKYIIGHIGVYYIKVVWQFLTHSLCLKMAILRVIDNHKLQVNSSCQMVRDTSGLEVFETRSVARCPRRHDSVAGWNECIRSFRPSAFGLWVMQLFEYTISFSLRWYRDSTRGHKKGRDSRSQVWTKHLLCEWAVHQACDKRCWTDELGSDAKSRGLGLRFVHKSCLARGHFRVFDESEAFMATRGAKCLVLHASQPSKFGYCSVAAKSQRFAVRSCSASLKDSFGCSKSA